MRSLKARIFRAGDERFNLFLPVLLIAILLVGASGHKGGWNPYFYNVETMDILVVDLLFLNVTHNAFTIMMMASFPELRPWLNRDGKRSESTFYLQIALLWIVLTGFFLCVLVPGGAKFYGAFVLISAIFPTQHGLAQSFGLSLLYNKLAEPKASEALLKNEKIERALVQVLMLLTTVGILAVQLPFMRESLETARLSKDLELTLFWTSVAICSVIVLWVLRYPPNIRRQKVLFALRYLIWAFSVVSPFAIMATKVVHGVEYFFVTKKMASQSRFVRWHWSGAVVLLLVFVFGIFRTFYYKPALWSQSTAPAPLLYAIIASASVAFSFVHYYLDRQMFLMRHELNRRTVGALLR